MRWNACCHCVSALRVRLAGIGCHCVAALRLRLVGIGWNVSDTNFSWIQKATLAPWNRSAECALERLLPLRFSAASAPCGDRLPLRCGAAAAPCRDRLERFGHQFFLDSESNVSPLEPFCGMCVGTPAAIAFQRCECALRGSVAIALRRCGCGL